MDFTFLTEPPAQTASYLHADVHTRQEHGPTSPCPGNLAVFSWLDLSCQPASTCDPSSRCYPTCRMGQQQKPQNIVVRHKLLIHSKLCITLIVCQHIPTPNASLTPSSREVKRIPDVVVIPAPAPKLLICVDTSGEGVGHTHAAVTRLGHLSCPERAWRMPAAAPDRSADGWTFVRRVAHRAAI